MCGGTGKCVLYTYIQLYDWRFEYVYIPMHVVTSQHFNIFWKFWNECFRISGNVSLFVVDTNGSWTTKCIDTTVTSLQKGNTFYFLNIIFTTWKSTYERVKLKHYFSIFLVKTKWFPKELPANLEGML